MKKQIELRCQSCNKLLLKYNSNSFLDISIKCPRCKFTNEVILSKKEL